MRLIAAFVIVWFGFSDPGFAAATHCANDEMIVFNCSVGKKTVSVCASGAMAKTSGYLQYRFGPIGSPELVYPDKKAAPNQSVSANILTLAGGGGAYLRFIRNRYSYVVYTAIGRGWGEKAGVTVEKDLKRQADLACKDQAISELGPDFFDRAGLSIDQHGFELP